jgi:uncharacterized protein (DUF2062 family)
LKRFVYHKILRPLLPYLKQGISPGKLALTLALGTCFGIIPVLGLNTVLLAILALLFRLNLPAIQIVNFALYAFQLILFVPFLQIGQYLFLEKSIPLNFEEFELLYKNGMFNAFVSLWQINLAGLMVWAILSLPLGLAIYYKSLDFFNKWKLSAEIS